MNLIQLPEQEKVSYNRFVSQSEDGSFLQSWEWGEWQVHLGRTVSRFKIVDKSGEWIGAFQAVEMPIGLSQSYAYIPYGPVMKNIIPSEALAEPKGPLSDSSATVGMTQLVSLLKSQFSNSIFIRIEPKELIGLSAYRHASLQKTKNIQPAKTLVIDLGKPEDELLSEMHHKTRYNIKVAQKHGVVVKRGFGVEGVELIAETSSRQGFVSHPLSYYQELVGYLSGDEVKAETYVAEFQGKTLASAIMIDFGGTRTYLFGGSSDEHKNVMAPYLLHWQAMLDAKARGIYRYDFWGIETASGETPGFVRFKLGFGGREAQYTGAHDIINKPLLYKLYGIMRAVNRWVKK